MHIDYWNMFSLLFQSTEEISVVDSLPEGHIIKGSTGNHYLVQGSPLSCQCPDWRKLEMPCKHILLCCMQGILSGLCSTFESICATLINAIFWSFSRRRSAASYLDLGRSGHCEWKTGWRVPAQRTWCGVSGEINHSVDCRWPSGNSLPSTDRVRGQGNAFWYHQKAEALSTKSNDSFYFLFIYSILHFLYCS